MVRVRNRVYVNASPGEITPRRVRMERSMRHLKRSPAASKTIKEAREEAWAKRVERAAEPGYWPGKTLGKSRQPEHAE